MTNALARASEDLERAWVAKESLLLSHHYASQRTIDLGEKMDASIGHTILAALAAGALDGAKDATKKAVADGYAALREAIVKKYKHHGEVAKALEKLEQKPQSKGHAQVLEEELNSCGASTDQALVQQAAQLMTLVQSMPNMGSGAQIAQGNGIAQADRQSTASVVVTHRTE
jgi:hypothetical protein